MTNCHRARCLLAALPLPLLLLNGCMASKPQQFATAFLPSASAFKAFDAGEPPQIQPNLYSSALPKPLPPMLPDPARAADTRVLPARRLNLDDVRPGVGQKLGAERAGEDVREIDDPDTGERRFV